MRKPEDPCRDPASEARDDWAEIERDARDRQLERDAERELPAANRLQTETDDEARGQA